MLLTPSSPLHGDDGVRSLSWTYVYRNRATSFTGSKVADDWRRFKEQFGNYELAADIHEASQEKRAAVFLTCIGNDAYDVYRAMEFQNDGDRKKLDPIIAAFQKFCVGAVNVIYERYVFHRRVQESGERFDVFLGEVRRLARTYATSLTWKNRWYGIESSLASETKPLVANYCKYTRSEARTDDRQ